MEGLAYIVSHRRPIADIVHPTRNSRQQSPVPHHKDVHLLVMQLISVHHFIPLHRALVVREFPNLHNIHGHRSS